MAAWAGQFRQRLGAMSYYGRKKIAWGIAVPAVEYWES